jgi:hypothetical protein
MTVRTRPVLPFITLRNIALKGYLTVYTEMNVCHCFNFAALLQSVKIYQIFTLIYHLTFRKGMRMTSQGRCKQSQGR